MKRVVFIGATGIARVVIDIVRLRGIASEYDFAGIIDDNRALTGQRKYDLIILGTFEELPKISLEKGITDAVICIPENYMRVRKNYFSACRNLGIRMLSAIHSHAVISSDVSMGEGVIVMAGVVINPGVKIGNNVIIFSNATIEHDCTIEDNVYIAPGVQLGGHVKVGDSAMLGIGSIIMPQRIVGRESVVGAGALVTRNVDPESTVTGVPAKKRTP